VLDLAELEPDRRLPELVAGYARGAAPAVPYPVACRPQAWDAAALLALARLLT
jgi:glycogen debranching enzyme